MQNTEGTNWTSEVKSAYFFVVLLFLALTPLLLISGCGDVTNSGDKTDSASLPSLTLIFPDGYSVNRSTGALSSNAKATALTAPAYVTGITLTITGENIETQVFDVPLDTGIVSGTLPPGVYTFSILVTTNIGLTFTGSQTIDLESGANADLDITLTVNAPPTITSITISNSAPAVGDTVTASCSATDADGDTITYAWSGAGSGSGQSVSRNIPADGTYTFTCTASDGRGGVATASVSATVGTVTPPGVITWFQATPGDGQVQLLWDPYGTAPFGTSFNIYWSLTPGVTPATGNKINIPDWTSCNVPAATCVYTHTGLTNGNATPYYYIVTAVDTGGESAPSAEVSATPTSAPVNGACGTASGKTYLVADTTFGADTFCSVGASNPAAPTFPGPGGTTNWSCIGTNGGGNAACSANRNAPAPVNGVCGTADKKIYLFTDTTFGADTFCSVGTSNPAVPTFPPPVPAASTTWNCIGSNGGTNAACVAFRNGPPAPVNGVCGTASKIYLATDTTFGVDTFCSVGASNPAAPAFPGQGGATSWNCMGTNGGGSATCLATRNPNDPLIINLVFPDAILQRCVNGNALPGATVSQMVTLNCNVAGGIASLVGIEQLTALVSININNNQVVDVTPLSTLTSLWWLAFRNNQVVDVAPLATLTALRQLYLSGNPIGKQGVGNIDLLSPAPSAALDLSNNLTQSCAELGTLLTNYPGTVNLDGDLILGGPGDIVNPGVTCTNP